MALDVRLFTGLSLPPEVIAKLETLLEEIRPLARIRWSPIPDLHITTKFIGKWPFSRVPELCRYLDNLPRIQSFPVTLSGLRYFSGPNRSWVLYARVEPSEGLSALAMAMDEGLAQIGIRREPGEYTPHVTLGRIPGANPWSELDARVDGNLATPFGTFEAKEYHLYESTSAGYIKCASIPLIDGSRTL